MQDIIGLSRGADEYVVQLTNETLKRKFCNSVPAGIC